MKKIKISIILIQVIAIFFLTNGIFQLKIFSVSEKYECAINYFDGKKSGCWDYFYSKDESFSMFLSNILLWRFFGLLFGVILISFLNWKNKISVLNTILASVLVYTIFLFNLFAIGIIAQLFNSFGSAFSNDFKIQFFIGGITFTIIGLIISYLSVRQDLFNTKKTQLN